jgi:hypothetical protein
LDNELPSAEYLQLGEICSKIASDEINTINDKKKANSNTNTKPS